MFKNTLKKYFKTASTYSRHPTFKINFEHMTDERKTELKMFDSGT